MSFETNEELYEFYEEIYREGAEEFFTSKKTDKEVTTDEMVLDATDWKGKRVLDVGCGTGHTASMIAESGAASVVGIDYSQEAIDIARSRFTAPNLEFRHMDVSGWEEEVDVVVCLGTLEHLDDPESAVERFGRLIAKGGEVVLTCPCFLNLRGMVYVPLLELLDVPMSLTDLHVISPWDIRDYLADTDLRLERFESFDGSWGNGEEMVRDFRDRLSAALPDADLPADNVEEFCDWLERAVRHFGWPEGPDLEGATGLYVLRHDC